MLHPLVVNLALTLAWWLRGTLLSGSSVSILKDCPKVTPELFPNLVSPIHAQEATIPSVL